MNSEWTGPAPSQETVIANLRNSNKVLRDELFGDRKRAFRAFRRGMILGAAVMAAAIFAADQAYSETIAIGNLYVNGASQNATTVSIDPSTKPGELAVITFVNRYVNDGNDDGTYPLSMGDVLTVEIKFAWDRDPLLGSDAITVIVPPGITCQPEDCSITVMEGFEGQVILFDWRGM